MIYEPPVPDDCDHELCVRYPIKVITDLIEQRDEYHKKMADLQYAVNKFCEANNNYGYENHTLYDKAIDELYRLARENGYRPRYRAKSVSCTEVRK